MFLPDGSAWASSSEDIYYLTPDMHKKSDFSPDYSLKYPLVHSSFRGLAIAPDHSLWLGTQYGGMVHFVPADNEHPEDIWQVYNAEDGLIDNRITVLKFDNKGMLWVGTENGLMKCGVTP